MCVWFNKTNHHHHHHHRHWQTKKKADLFAQMNKKNQAFKTLSHNGINKLTKKKKISAIQLVKENENC